MAPGEWRFCFDVKKKRMSDDELIEYQRKLIELRDKYGHRVSQLSGCRFHMGSLDAAPPLDNIFAEFDCDCKRHTPKCVGWLLLWNPYLPPLSDDTRLLALSSSSSLHNHCATWQFKSVSKMIQRDLAHAFPTYFEMYDDDDTHQYSSEISYDYSVGFKTKEEEYPDYVTGNLVEK